MIHDKFKHIEGVCDDSRVLNQLDEYLKQNAEEVNSDAIQSIKVNCQDVIRDCELFAGIYVSDNAFRITVMDDKGHEIGYCTVLKEYYIERSI